ncbi:MAG TPA: class I SAM-dependent methyltransferase [Vicinamibacterales bacterium]
MAGSQPGEWRRVARRISQRLIYRASGERDDCPACGSRALHDLDVLPLRAGRTGFVCACGECGIVFSNPQPTPADLDVFYGTSGAWALDRQHVDDHTEGMTSPLGRSWTRLFDAMRTTLDVSAPPPGASVLDFGCGEGTMLDALQSCGWQTSGIEPATDRAFARHRRLLDIPQQPAFDLVLALHVLEHMPSPLELLRQLAGCCRAGGFLLLAVPRLDTLPAHRDYRYVLNGRAHIMAYTARCLEALLVRSGWDIVASPLEHMPRRVRVLARRTATPAGRARVGVEVARAAIAGYYAHQDSRSRVARMGLIRLAALRADAERRRAKAERKALALARESKDR